MLAGGVEVVERQRAGARDVGRGTAGFDGELVDALVGLAQRVGRAPGVPDVGVAGDEGERSLRALAADPDRRVGALHRGGAEAGIVQGHDLAVVGDGLAGEEAGDDLEGVLQQVEALARRGEGDAELGVLLVEPGGAERELQAAVRGVVDGHGLGGEHRGVAVGGAGDEQAEADALGDAGEGGEGGHALEGLARALAVHGLEVVEAPGAVEAEPLGQLHAPDDLVPRHALLGHVESEPHHCLLVVLVVPVVAGAGVHRQSRKLARRAWKRHRSSPALVSVSVSVSRCSTSA